MKIEEKWYPDLLVSFSGKLLVEKVLERHGSPLSNHMIQNFMMLSLWGVVWWGPHLLVVLVGFNGHNFCVIHYSSRQCDYFYSV